MRIDDSMAGFTQLMAMLTEQQLVRLLGDVTAVAGVEDVLRRDIDREMATELRFQVADFARAGGDVLEGAPPLVEQGEPGFAQPAQGPLDGVAGAGMDVQFLAALGPFDGNQDADARAVISGSASVGSPAAAAGQSAGKARARAAVRSCTEPGPAPETHSGNPPGLHTAWVA